MNEIQTLAAMKVEDLKIIIGWYHEVYFYSQLIDI